MSYEVKTPKNTKYNIVVFSTSYINPINDIDEISMDLVNTNTLPGIILFDLLACNGLSSNRYAEGYFDGKSIAYSSISSVKEIDENIKEFCDSYFRTNINHIKNSVLSKASLYNYLKSINKTLYTNV